MIHPSAIVLGDVVFGDGVEVGPGCVIDGTRGAVSLEAGVKLIASVQLRGPIEIGAGTVVYPFACLGFEPQDVKFDSKGGTLGVKIGSKCIIREHVTVHAASNGKPRATTVGDNCFLMVNAHVGHDALVQNHVVMVNNTAIGGHAELHERCTVGGGAAIHQFCRVGRLAFVSGVTPISAEVPPFTVVWGRNDLAGLNLVGMRRSGMSRDEITLVRAAFREAIKPNLSLPKTIEILRRLGEKSPAVMEMAEFYATCKRTTARYRSTQRGVDSDDDGVVV